MQFNNGAAIDFELIKANREQAVEEISEGNSGLKNLMNYCLDNDIETRASCGHDKYAYISFNMNEKNKNLLLAITRCILSNERLFESILIYHGNSDKEINCSFYILENEYKVDYIVFFEIILELLKKCKNYELYDIKEYEYVYQLAVELSNLGLNSVIEYLRLKKNSDDLVEQPEYGLDIYGDDRDYILNTMKENFPKFEYSTENVEVVISKKTYDINSYNDLKESVDEITEKVKSKTKKLR